MSNKLQEIISPSVSGYDWHYCSVGGVIRVIIETGEDIRHLPELDQKLWTVLSCPTKGLEFPEKTLQLLDTDGDAKIRVNEVVAASQWLCNVLRDPQLLIEGGDGLNLNDFSDTDEGKRLQSIARQILQSLGIDRDMITIADTSDSIAIFSKTRFNGDGVITANSTDDEALKDIIAKAIEKIGSVTDRSGEQGINQEILEKFYKACTDYAAWCHAAESDLPYGDDTEAALAAVDAIKAKMADYFMRCKLIAFDEDAAAALDVQVAKIESISGNDLNTCADEIATYPLARPNKECRMLLNGVVNPMWEGAFDALKTLVLDKDFAGQESISEDEWNAIVAKFDAFEAWKGAKAGTEVEELGLETVDKILAENRQADLQAIIDQDNAVADEVNAISEVDKLLFLKRDFYHLLRNYVTFADFYNRKESAEAVFQCGHLYIDQRCLDLCIRVEDMGKHADMAGLSGMYLVYCNCVSKVKNQTMTIVAVLTDGDIDGMREGKNAVFYDRDGQDWDAVVTKIVDNPISIRQAFWSPYRKLGNFITEKINKSAAEKEANSMSNLTAKTDSALTSAQADMAAAQADPEAAKAAQAAKAAEAKPAFDIAKFAGIFAAIGMALGMIGSAIVAIIDPWTNIIVLFFVLVICISGPSMFIAWSKLRKRNLGPILNANGWAINSKVLVNILFGATLTSMAKYPRLDLKSMSDPFVSNETPLWKKWLRGILIVVVLVGLVIGIMFLLHKGPFAKDCNLKVQSANVEMGTVKGDGIFKDYTYDTIVALPAEGYVFVNWNGNDELTSDTLAVYLLSDTAFVANFAPVPAPEPAPEEPAPAAE